MTLSRALGLLLGSCAFAAGAGSARTVPPSPAPGTASAVPAPESEWVTDASGRVQVLVELKQPAAATAYAAALGEAGLSRAAAKSKASAAGKRQAQDNRAAQERLASALNALGASEVYRAALAVDGISVMVDRAALPRIAALDGVKRVIPIYREYPTSSQSVPYIGAPNVWANSLGLPAGADGSGIRIGIIDTGTDYLHADFGGTGALADYQTESTNSAGFTTAGSFPTAKVVGGTDFAGDAYTGSNAPTPDPNPMDCNGHGSHVSGTAAGYGVTSGGTTFAGPYDANPATYSALGIAPGTAPKASLYSLRVFGCTGSTGLTVQAIDWAMDPNGDLDLSDHLDVINMSLGSSFGSAVNASSIASDNAAAAGVIVVTSAGNSGDTFFIAGSPGAATRAIATAASLDGGENVAAVQINTPAAIAGEYPAGKALFGPLPSGQTADAVIAQDDASVACGTSATDGCCAINNAAAVAGNICVVDRGTCNFNVKADNCQAAGAIGMIVVDNAMGATPPDLGGTDPTVVIPSVRMTLREGTQLKTTIGTSPPVNVTLLGGSGGDTLASFSSLGPRRLYGAPLRLKPDIAAPGLNIVSVQTGHTCLSQTGCTGVADPSGFQAGNQSLTISGTSMASPHMAGVMALLRQLKPDWTVEELKALAMNYATHDVSVFLGGGAPEHGLSRIGAGRVDPSQSALGDVVAFNAEETGLVSVTFEPEVVGVVSQIKQVRVVNKGPTAQTFDLSLDTVTDAPGVNFSLPGGASVTVPASGTVLLDVRMDADASQMDHTRDPALGATQGIQVNYGDLPRQFLSQKGAYLAFRQSGNLKLRLPVYMAEKPASAMAAADSIVTGGAPTGSTTIALSGQDLCTGTLGAGPTCTGSFPNDVESLVSPFELQVVSPRDPVNAPDYADIRYGGVAYLPGSPSGLTTDLVMFGMASWGDWSTPNDVTYVACVDTNEDGVYDRAIVNTNPSVFVAGAYPNDTFVRVVQNLGTGGFSILGLASPMNVVAPNVIDTSPHASNVMALAATPSQLGFTSTADTNFRYKLLTCSGSNPGCARSTTGDHCSPAPGTFYDQASGPYTYNWGAQGLNFGGDFLDEDLNGKSLPVTWNSANLTANGSLGALLLHFHNKSGTRAEVIPLDTAQRADLAIAHAVSAPTPAYGQNVTYTLTASNNGPNDATGVAVTDSLPAGVNYVSDDGGGAFDAATGTWTVGALANGASAVLHIVVSVDSTDQQCAQADIGSTALLDPNAANDRANVCLLAPRSADLALSMSVSSPTVLVGAPITYTITASNLGDDVAYGVNVQESFAAFPSLDPTGYTASQGSYDGATGVWNLAGLAKGQSATLALTFTAPNTAGALQESASGSSGASDPDTANNSASATTTVLSPAVVSGTLTVAGTFYPGGSVTYTAVLSNSAAFDQQDNPGNEFDLVLPPGLNLVSANATSGTAVATLGSNSVAWNGAVPAGGSVTITIAASVDAAAVAGSSLSAQAGVNYDADGNGTNETNAQSDDPAVGGASDPTVFTVVSPAQLSASKSVSGSFAPGGAITYSVVIANAGPAAQLDNPGSEFTDVLPATLSLVSASATSGTAVANTGTNTVTWDGSLPSGGSVTVTIQATISPAATPGAVSNQGTLSYDADGDGSNEATALTDDPTLAGSADPTVFTLASPSMVDATKTVSGSFLPGGAVSYTIVLSNHGSAPQLDNPGDEFVDVLPAALSLVSASASAGTATATTATNTVNWNGAIPAGGSVTLTIAATVSPTAPLGDVSNQGTVNFDGDGNGTNESSALTDDPNRAGAADPTVFAVTSPAVLGASKSVLGDFSPGGLVTYTIVLHNSGAAAQLDNPGDEFVDVLPAPLQLQSVVASGGTAVADTVGNTVHWNGSVPAGGNVTLSIVAKIDANAAPGTVSNQGTVNFDADGNGTNEASAPTDDPGQPGGADATSFAVTPQAEPNPAPIPALDLAGLAGLALLLAGLAVAQRRRSAPR